MAQCIFYTLAGFLVDLAQCHTKHPSQSESADMKTHLELNAESLNAVVTATSYLAYALLRNYPQSMIPGVRADLAECCERLNSIGDQNAETILLQITHSIGLLLDAEAKPSQG